MLRGSHRDCRQHSRRSDDAAARSFDQHAVGLSSASARFRRSEQRRREQQFTIHSFSPLHTCALAWFKTRRARKLDAAAKRGFANVPRSVAVKAVKFDREWDRRANRS